MIDPCLFE